MTERFDGRAAAQTVIERVRTSGTAPRGFVAGFVMGTDQAGTHFQKIKQKTAAAAGIDYRIYELPADATTDTARAYVRRITAHRTCIGALVQLPLPPSLNAQYVCNVIPPEKDVDVLSERGRGAFYAGRSLVLPPAVCTVQTILAQYETDLAAQHVAVIGIGALVGKPVLLWLARECASVLALDRGFDTSLLRDRTLVITSAGAPTLTPDMVAPGAGIIDFGYRVIDGASHGDLVINDAASLDRLAWYTPTPGGTGPLLVAHVVQNCFILAAS